MTGEPSSREIWLIVGGLMLGMFLQGLDTLLVVTALPTIAGELGGLDRLSWVLSAFLLTMTATVPLYGKVGDLIGRKRPYQFAVALFGLTSILCAAAQNIDQLIVARALKGIGGGGLMVLPFAIVADIVPAKSRARYQGVMGANIAVATLLGPLVGGFFVDRASWRIAFLIGVPPAILALLASRRLRLPARRMSWAGLDLAGAALVVAVSVVLLLGVTLAGHRFPWWSLPTASLVGLAAVLIGVFIACERLAADPVLPLALFRHPGFALLMVGTFFGGIAMFGPWTLMPIFLQLITDATATTSGLLLLPLIVSITVSSWLAGRRISHTGRCKSFVVAGMTLATIGFALYLSLDTSSTRAHACGFMVVTGIGLGLLIQPLMVIAQGMVDHRQLGVATSTVSFFRQLGQAFGAAIVLSVFATRLASALAASIPPLGPLDEKVLAGDPEAVRELPAVVRTPVLEAFAEALHDGFLSMIPFAVLAIIALALLPKIRLTDEEAPAVQTPSRLGTGTGTRGGAP